MSHEEVTAAIRKVHSGARVIPQSVSKALEECGPESQLSRREVEVLELIAKRLQQQGNRPRPGHRRGHRQVARQPDSEPSRCRRPHRAIVAALQRGIIHLP
jgi:hypothetical protein